MAFKKGDIVIIMALALAALAVSWAVAQVPPSPGPLPPNPVPVPPIVPTLPVYTGTATMGPVEQIGATGNTGGLSPLQEEARKGLCRDAPLNSFGSACEGYTWHKDLDGTNVELRTKRGGFPIPQFGFLGVWA